MQNVCADVTPPPPPTGRFVTRGTIAPRPNISVDGEKVGAVYYWTGWCIDRPGSRPDFGGLAALPSSLSFPQHQSRWLQLPADQRCNGLVSRRKARGQCHCARKTRHAGKSGIFAIERSGADRPPRCCDVRFTEKVENEFVSCLDHIDVLSHTSENAAFFLRLDFYISNILS